MTHTNNTRTAPNTLYLARRGIMLAGVSTMACIGLANPAMAAEATAFETISKIVSEASASASLSGKAAPKAFAVKTAAAATVLAKANVKVEKRAANPVLSIGLVDADTAVRRGAPAKFIGYSNYPAFVDRTELRIFDASVPASGTPHAIVSADSNGAFAWTPTDYASTYVTYVYRVYDKDGNFDETKPQALTLLSAAHALPKQAMARADFGVVDAAAKRGIVLSNAIPVMVSGEAPNASVVRVSGQIAPTDTSGKFAASQLLPDHCSAVDISAVSDCGSMQKIASQRQDWRVQEDERGNRANIFTAPEPSELEEQPLVLAQDDGLQITFDPEGERTSENPYSVKIRTDETHVNPVLAIGLVDSERTIVKGQPATFVSYTNYPSFIEKGELRVFRQGVGVDAAPLAVIASDEDGVTRWTPAITEAKDLFYVYRVYDAKGRFDETQPHELTLLDEPFEHTVAPVRPLFGSQDEAAIRNINLTRGTTITVTGSASPNDELVTVEGQSIPIDETGFFVSQQIIDRDISEVEVNIGTSSQINFTAQRDVETKGDDWFIVGQGDLTFVSNGGSDTAVEVSGDPLTDGDYLTSRAAFYAKGKLQSGVTITSSLDTGETLLKDIFSNLDRKDPRQLLRRIDSNQYYTTYGDDSTLVEDAPTQGRFYLKVQKDKSSLLVGNFTTDIQQAELAQLNRGVFGAIVDHKSLGTTEFGASKLQVTAFASDPGTIPGRDEFRGTGGSLYFLGRRDITVGSDRLSVEVRDRDTGLVISRRDLRPQEDYDVDYFQGRIVLLQPLSSFSSDGSLIRQSSGPGNVPVLVANYEYTPAVGDLSGYTLGGRVAGWMGDTLRLGVTAQRETTGAADQTLLGADATVRLHAGTYVKAEVAQSEGPGFGQANSVDGGLSFTNIAATGAGIGGADIEANAYRGEIAVDLAEIQGKNADLGRISAFYENFEGGFSSNGQLTQADTTRWGAAANVKLSEMTRVDAKIERLETDGIGKRTVASADIAQKLGAEVTATIGVRHDDEAAGLLNNSAQNGKRTDGALQVDYDPLDKNWSIYGFGQLTLDRDATRSSNNRAGLGGKAELTDRSSLSGELSAGDGGLGAQVELAHRYGNGSEAYLGYGLITDRTDLGLDPVGSLAQTNRGTLTMGTRHRFNSALSIHGENKIGHGGEAPSVVNSFGLNWDPSEHWSFSASVERGEIDDATTGIFRRKAATFGIGYTDEKVQLATNIEARLEEGAGRDQEVYLVRNTAAVELNPNWRALGRLNFAIADTDTNDVRLADFVEGTVGFAYRPILNDRLNLLARYTYLQDLGPIGQVTSGGETAAPKQKSHIFSIDGNFNVTKTLTLGGKYAVREGSISLGRDSDTFVTSNTQLAVARLDWRLVKQWDAVLEGHYLTNDLASDDRIGGIAAIYRHLGNNVKIGVGYSFSDFSTDLSDQSFTSDGWFINLLGKF